MTFKEIDYTLNDPQLRELNKLILFYPDKNSMENKEVQTAIDDRMIELGIPDRTDQPKSSLNPKGRSKACSCGARHTAFPNHHLGFCDLKVW